MKESDDEGNGGREEKKHKKRQKRVLANLKQQIEFYFSEPNLQKDRFLRQKIMENPQGCVEIATIASFNRMKQLCDDISLVMKAMKMCPSVEVVDDKWVKSSKPLAEPKNVDSVTVYVEKLPRHANHDWIKSIFSSYGNVVYVSLPRYKSTRDIKGFAFVEFEKENEAKLALEAFEKKEEVEKHENIEQEVKEEDIDEAKAEKQPKKNKKRKQKPGESENQEEKGKGKEKKSKNKKEEESNIDSISDSSGACTSSDKDNQSGRNKRKRNIENVYNHEKEMSGKILKQSEVNGKVLAKERNETENDSETVGIKRKREDGSTSASSSAGLKRKRREDNASDEDSTVSKRGKEPLEESKDTEDEEVTEKKHKKRKRKKKEKEKEKTDVPDLRVISKTEWLRLKKEYQKLQREAMRENKTKLKSQRPQQSTNSNKKASDLSEDTSSVQKTEKPNGLPDVPSRLEMQPGVVLKYITEEVIEKPKLRNIFSSVAPVSYLEREDGKEMGFVRFATKEGCEKVVEAVKNGALENIKIEKLTEKEDQEYWERLNNDRIERFQQKKRKKKQRGTQKITEKLDAQARKGDHIHFDDV